MSCVSGYASVGDCIDTDTQEEMESAIGGVVTVEAGDVVLVVIGRMVGAVAGGCTRDGEGTEEGIKASDVSRHDGSGASGGA